MQHEGLAHQRHSEYYLQQLRRLDTQYRQGGEHVSAALVSFDKEWGQIQEGHSWTSSRGGEAIQTSELAVKYAVAGSAILSWRLQPTERLEWLRPGLDAARSLNDLESEADIWEETAEAHGKASDWTKARDACEVSWRISKELGDERRKGRALGRLGLAYLSLDDRTQARQHLERALRIARKTGDRSAEGRHLGSLGLASRGAEAGEHFSHALEIAREVGDRHAEVSHLGCLGTLWLQRGHFGVMSPNERFVHPNILTRNSDPDGCRQRHLEAVQRRHFRLALNYFEKGLVIAREIGDRSAEARQLGNLGTALLELGHVDQAIKHHNEALKLAREMGERETERQQLENFQLARMDPGRHGQPEGSTTIDWTEHYMAHYGE